jgi:dTDP-4-dehydrorhamnose 3,5-epimerase
MPPGFAHGFCVLSEFADLHYKVSQLYDPADEGGIYWADSDIGVCWPIEAPIVSERDNSYSRLRELSPKQLPVCSVKMAQPSSDGDAATPKR